VILAGDIGGTNARLALYRSDGSRVRQARFDSHEYPDLVAVVREFLGSGEADGERASLEAATFGIAGPVMNQKVTATNFPWTIDGAEVAAALGTRVTLLNDVVAVAWGALASPDDQIARVQGAERPGAYGGTVAIISAGTGLGEAALVWDGDRGHHLAMSTEGGHCTFAPNSPLEAELQGYLHEICSRNGSAGHVSTERVVAGPGIGHIYDFLVGRKGRVEAPAAAAKLTAAGDRNHAVTDLGRSGESAIARDALDLFLRAYGSETGNLALKTLSSGGVFVAGGIAAGLVDLIKPGADGTSGFLTAFASKGRMGKLLGAMPIAVVLDPDVGLRGSATHALRTIGKLPAG
jgi:glucokinase